MSTPPATDDDADGAEYDEAREGHGAD